MEACNMDLGGRPALFESVDEFNTKVDEYFAWIQGDKGIICDSDEDGNPQDREVYTRWPEPPTITGLCLFLGFESRQSFYDYEKRDGFSYAVKRAKLRIELEYEKTVQSAKNPAGPIFVLKNLGWSDKQEVDHRSSDGSMSPAPTSIVFTKPDAENQ